jgi:PAS domain S-box-containing protein
MIHYFKTILSSEYDRDPGFIRLVRVILSLSTLTALVMAVIEAISMQPADALRFVSIIGALAVLSGISFLLTYRNILWPGKILFPVAVLVGVTFMAISANGLHDSSMVVFSLVIVIAGLIAGQKAIPLATLFTLLGVWTVAFADKTGITQAAIARNTGWDDITVVTLIQVVVAASLNELMRRLNSSLETSRANEQAQIRSVQELRELQTTLEQRVSDRVKALNISAEVSRRLSTILDQKELVIEVVEEVKAAFNYYHAHIYLIQESGGDLIMAGGTGEAGATMLARGHKIQKGRGLVGRAAETNAPVLVPDTSRDPDWLPNPLLPETKSEIAVPISAGDKVLGVLDVQNNVAGSLGEQDVDLLRTIANQVAVAVQNARLYTQAEDAIQEARSLVDYAPEAIVVVDLETGLFTDPNENAVQLYGLSREELAKVGPAQMSPPRQPDGRPSTEKAMEKINDAMQGRSPVFEWTHRNAQGEDIPCEVRLVRLPGAHPRVRASVTNIAERKHLEELTIQRARQQEAINTITQRIQSATTVEAALQIAARELGHALGMKSTLITLDLAAPTVGPVSGQATQ